MTVVTARSGRRSSSAPAFAVAVLALVVAFAGGAFAATKIDGKTIKKGTVASKQVKNGSLTGTDVKDGSIAKADLDGATVAALQGPAGPQGPAGTSMLGQTIPSGTTVSGGFGISGYNAGPAGTVYTTYVELPLPAQQEINDPEILSAPGSGYANPDAACSGSRLAPTAPAGKVCLYSGWGFQFGAVTGSQLANPMSPTYHFKVRVEASTANAQFGVEGVWAYTAP